MNPYRKPRRWTSLPAPSFHGSESLDQGVVLEELRSPLGLVLWTALRDILLWSRASPDERPLLFHPRTTRLEHEFSVLLEVRSHPEVAAALSPYLRLLRSPGTVDRRRVASVCERICDWAGERRCTGTALAFAQAAAHVDPADGLAACRAGRAALLAGAPARASGWFTAAISRGRLHHEWDAYANGLAGLCEVGLRAGDHARAERYALRRYRACFAHGVREEIPRALRDLTRVAIARGDATTVARWAGTAVDRVPRGHPALIETSASVGCYLAEAGWAAPAADLLAAVLRQSLTAPDRLRCSAALAHAAGDLDDPRLLAETIEAALPLLDEVEDEEVRSTALFWLASGASRAGAEGTAADLIRRGRGHAVAGRAAGSAGGTANAEEIVRSPSRRRPPAGPVRELTAIAAALVRKLTRPGGLYAEGERAAH
jgi:hypothetical protein